MSPVRIQRKRTKGWRMPEGAVYVGRGTDFGNPFVVGQFVPPNTFWRKGDHFIVESSEMAVLLYRHWLAGTVPDDLSGRRYTDLIAVSRLRELRGKDLVCWCPPGHACHADVLLELANAPVGAVGERE